MINLNISIFFHFFFIAIAVFLLQYFFNTLYDFFMDYNYQKKLSLEKYELEKKKYIELRDNIKKKEELIDQEVVELINIAVRKSENNFFLKFNNTISVIDLSYDDKLIIENNIKKIIKER